MKNSPLFKLPPLTEAQEAETLASYLLLLQRTGKILLYSHVPHETYTKFRSVKLKNVKQGVRAGVPDYIIVMHNTVLFIELKRTRGGVVSIEQKEWITHLDGKTIASRVCLGYEQARLFINSYLK